MAIVNPTPPTTPPALPQRADRATFSARVDAGFSWFVTLISEVYSLAQNAYNNATESSASASAASTSASTATTQATNASNSAIAAAATANAVLWVSSTSYTAYTSNVISPINGKTYRRLITGAGTTDPSLDATNWAGLSGEVAGLKLLATLTPTAAANVDALSVFTSTYDDYYIVATGIKGSANDALNFRLAVAGAVVSSADYYNNGAGLITYSYVGVSSSVDSAQKGANYFFTIRGANSTSIKAIEADSYAQTGASTFAEGSKRSIFNSVNVLTGFRLYWNAGANFAAQGSIRIYGVLK